MSGAIHLDATRLSGDITRRKLPRRPYSLAVTVTHPVPYVSQFASSDLVEGFVTDVVPLSTDPRWAETGAADVVQYAWWARRMCGMACLRMVLAARGVAAPSLV